MAHVLNLPFSGSTKVHTTHKLQSQEPSEELSRELIFP